jgi:hypothetical protein
MISISPSSISLLFVAIFHYHRCMAFISLSWFHLQKLVLLHTFLKIEGDYRPKKVYITVLQGLLPSALKPAFHIFYAHHKSCLMCFNWIVGPFFAPCFFTAEFSVYLIKEKRSWQVWPVDREWFILLSTWSHLWYTQGSFLPIWIHENFIYTMFCCNVIYLYVLPGTVTLNLSDPTPSTWHSATGESKTRFYKMIYIGRI